MDPEWRSMDRFEHVDILGTIFFSLSEGNKACQNGQSPTSGKTLGASQEAPLFFGDGMGRNGTCWC